MSYKFGMIVAHFIFSLETPTFDSMFVSFLKDTDDDLNTISSLSFVGGSSIGFASRSRQLRRPGLNRRRTCGATTRHTGLRSNSSASCWDPLKTSTSTPGQRLNLSWRKPGGSWPRSRHCVCIIPPLQHCQSIDASLMVLWYVTIEPLPKTFLSEKHINMASLFKHL